MKVHLCRYEVSSNKAGIVLCESRKEAILAMWTHTVNLILVGFPLFGKCTCGFGTQSFSLRVTLAGFSGI